ACRGGDRRAAAAGRERGGDGGEPVGAVERVRADRGGAAGVDGGAGPARAAGERGDVDGGGGRAGGGGAADRAAGGGGGARRGVRAWGWVGVVVGLVVLALFAGLGVVEVARGGAWSNGGGAEVLGMTFLVGSSICWASGSRHARSAPRPASGLASVGMHLTCG